MNLTVEQEVLNAASDDWESLEQIYRSVCLDFSAENYVPDDPTAFYWRDSNRGFSLAQLAEATIQLVDSEMLQARLEDGTFVATVSENQLWRCWFKTSEKGKQALHDSIT